MAFSRNHALVMITPDDPAYENKPSNWNAAFVVSGATVGGIAYFPTATTEAMSGMTWNATGAAGEGLAIAAGTATTDVAALSITRTNNNAAVATGVKIAFTDTSSATGFLPFQILGTSSGAANLINVDKSGNVNIGTTTPVSTATPLQFNAGATYASATGNRAKAKIRVYDDGSGGVYGLGVSPGIFEYHADASAVHNFYSGDVLLMKINKNDGSGLGLAITPPTATIASAAALSVVRTNNNAAVDTGVKFTFTDTSSAAGFLPFQILGTSGGATNLFSVNKTGDLLGQHQVSKLGGASNSFAALYLDYTNTATVGNVTINKPSGRVNLGAGGTQLTLTNSLITAASRVFLNADGAPGNIVAVQLYSVTTAGSCTINAVPAVTNQTAIDFLVINAD